MAYLPELTQAHQSVLTTSTFLGYDHRPVTQDGALYDMTNLSGDAYPLLTTRRTRGKVLDCEAPYRVAVSDGVVYVVDGDKIIMIEDLPPGATPKSAEKVLYEGLRFQEATRLVFMGAYLCVFPDNVYINTHNWTDRGNMGAQLFADGRTIKLQMCKEDGSDFDKPITASGTKPQSPENGDLWLDTSGEVHGLKQYNAYTDEWVNVLTTFVRIGYGEEIGPLFEKGDVISISGMPEDNKQLADLNGDKLIYAKGDEFIVVAGLLDQNTDTTNEVVFERRVPEMDYVVECDNRLWGCFYGTDEDGKFVNEIYACKLGDFKNWRSYQGISTDSYAATVGTDGPFTGVAVLRGSPVFFKEDCVHKVTGKIPAQFAITTTDCAGVQVGSWDSLRVVNETLYYKGNTSVMAYDGSLPVAVSDVFGGVRYRLGRAGVLGKTYYLCMEDAETEKQVLFTLDTETGFWYKQDDADIISFASIYNTMYEDNLFYIDQKDKCLHLMRHRPNLTTAESGFAWEAVFGTFGYEYPDRKYLSRFNIRMKMDAGAEVDLYIQYDSDGVWHKQGCMRGTTTRTYMIPVIPRRCDHCQIKLAGHGAMTLYSISRVLEMGGDG